MKIKSLLLIIIFWGNIFAQNYYKPTQEDLDLIYNSIEKVQIDKFLKTNNILNDISENTRDSIFLILINDYRISKGLNTLTNIPDLDSACKMHMNWMLNVQKVNHEESNINIDGVMYAKFTNRINKFDTNWINQHKIIFENCGTAQSIIGNDPTIQFKKIKKNIFTIFSIHGKNHQAIMIQC